MASSTIMTVIAAPDWGGLATLVERTTPLIRTAGFRRLVVVPKGASTVWERLEKAGCEVTHVDLVRPRKTANLLVHAEYVAKFHRNVRDLARLARDYEVSAIEAVGLLNLQPLFVSRKVRRPLIWQLHSTLAPRPIRILLGRIVSRQATVIMTSGQRMIERHGGLHDVADKVVAFCAPVDSCRFHPNGDARHRIRADWGISNDEIVVGTLGNRGWQKNHEMIVEVATLLRGIDPRLRFIICGSKTTTNELYYHQRVISPILHRKLNEGGYVRVVEQVHPAEEVLNAFDIFVLTSVAEGISIVTAEAMATGLPIVATDVGSVSDIVRPHENGILVRVNDARGMADGILELMDPERRTAMGRKSRQIALAFATPEKCAEAHILAYEKALAGLEGHSVRNKGSFAGRMQKNAPWILTGYYGGKNVGDEVMLRGFLDEASKYGSDFIVAYRQSCSMPRVCNQWVGLEFPWTQFWGKVTPPKECPNAKKKLWFE